MFSFSFMLRFLCLTERARERVQVWHCSSTICRRESQRQHTHTHQRSFRFHVPRPSFVATTCTTRRQILRLESFGSSVCASCTQSECSESIYRHHITSCDVAIRWQCRDRRSDWPLATLGSRNRLPVRQLQLLRRQHTRTHTTQTKPKHNKSSMCRWRCLSPSPSLLLSPPLLSASNRKFIKE